MSRIIRTDSLGKQRAQLARSIAFALRTLAEQREMSDDARDLSAFIALALRSIHDGIDPSVEAWEKRGYWVKADRFRMEWAWSGPMAVQLAQAVRGSDSARVAELCMQIAQRLHAVKVASAPRLGKPWAGAFQRLQADWPG